MVEDIGDLAGLSQDQSDDGLHAGDAPVLARRHSAARRLLRQVLRVPRRDPGRALCARGDRRARQRGRRLLLSAHRQDHVFRRAGRRPSSRCRSSFASSSASAAPSSCSSSSSPARSAAPRSSPPRPSSEAMAEAGGASDRLSPRGFRKSASTNSAALRRRARRGSRPALGHRDRADRGPRPARPAVGRRRRAISPPRCSSSTRRRRDARLATDLLRCRRCAASGRRSTSPVDGRSGATGSS